jgi:hypothetical protein
MGAVQSLSRGARSAESAGWLGRNGVIAVFASYAVVFGLLTLPWFLAAPAAVPIGTANHVDDTRNLTWVLWWVAGHLTHGLTGIFDTPINYPARGQLTGSEHFASIQILFLPLYAVTQNPFLALKAVLFLSYPLAAFAMNRLLLRLGFDSVVAWVMGFVYALGALQVPASVYLLHALAVFPPTIAWALHRLRDSTDVPRALLFGLLFAVGAFAAYYTAAILLVVVALWSMAELARPLPGRLTFLGVVVAVVLSCLALLALASLPYLSRAEIADPSGSVEKLAEQLSRAWLIFVARAPAAKLGGVSLLLGVAGCLGLFDRRRRGLAFLALLLVGTSVFLMSSGPLALAELVPKSPIAVLLTLPVRFFRIAVRFASITGLGLALLGAIALERARLGFPRGVAHALVLTVIAAVAWERGSVLFTEDLDVSRSFTSDRAVYEQVARLAERNGAGPLLELPLHDMGVSLQPEAMIGHMWHHLPLLTGHTGYTPPQRQVVDAAIARLPSPAALQDLADMTRLRWILLRPASNWGSAENRERFLRDLMALSGVGPRWQLGDFDLIAVTRRPRHPGWHDALEKPRRDRTLLGAPLVRLDEARTASVIKLRGHAAKLPSIATEPGRKIFLSLRLENRGEETWPAALAAQSALPLEVVLGGRWQQPDRESRPAPARPLRFRLARDVPSGEVFDLNEWVVVPETPGRYHLIFSLDQIDGARFAGDRNPPLAVTVDVGARGPANPPTAPGAAPSEWTAPRPSPVSPIDRPATPAEPPA